jgi:hypothetical protein
LVSNLYPTTQRVVVIRVKHKATIGGLPCAGIDV